MKRKIMGTAVFGLMLVMPAFGQKMTVKDTDANLLMEVTDEGSTGSIKLLSGADPDTVTDKLYNKDGILYWSGSELGISGASWSLKGNSATSPGSIFLGTTDNQAMEIKVNGNRIMRFEPGDNIIGGFRANRITPGVSGATIAGGGQSTMTNMVTDCFGVVGGGYMNQAGDGGGTVWDANYATVAGGYGNQSHSEGSTVGGGSNNHAYRAHSTVAGGSGNWAMGEESTVGGGSNNSAKGELSTVTGGQFNVARGQFSLAAGQYAHANHDGSFVWGDASTTDSVASSGNNQFVVRATGGMHLDSYYGILLNAADRPIITRKWDVFTSGSYTNVGRWGMFMEPGVLIMGIPAISARYFQVAKYAEDGTRTGLATVDQAGNLQIAGTLSESSDRNRKENIVSIDESDILRRLSEMPVSEWSYREDDGTRHMGPMAQDFRDAFGLGKDETHIAAVDADGVAFAAIRELYRELKEKENEIAQLKSRLEAVERR
jgi:trimeric autotransporter adhesin